MKKYLIFKFNIGYETEIEWKAGIAYLVTNEDKENYYTGEFEAVGINKELENQFYTVRYE